jgi:hypothetical protein
MELINDSSIFIRFSFRTSSRPRPWAKEVRDNDHYAGVITWLSTRIYSNPFGLTVSMTGIDMAALWAEILSGAKIDPGIVESFQFGVGLGLVLLTTLVLFPGEQYLPLVRISFRCLP